MSALNHVITWDPKTNNWIRVKAAEASKNCGMRTISAQQRIFVCELCKQYVLLTRGDGKRAPHFRHNRAEEDKNCPEHSIGSHPITYDPSDYSLPFYEEKHGRYAAFCLIYVFVRSVHVIILRHPACISFTNHPCSFCLHSMFLPLTSDVLACPRMWFKCFT